MEFKAPYLISFLPGSLLLSQPSVPRTLSAAEVPVPTGGLSPGSSHLSGSVTGLTCL